MHDLSFLHHELRGAYEHYRKASNDFLNVATDSHIDSEVGILQIQTASKATAGTLNRYDEALQCLSDAIEHHRT